MKPKTKTTIGPAPAYREYRPDLATRLAQEKAAKDQPAMISLASKVPDMGKGFK